MLGRDYFLISRLHFVCGGKGIIIIIWEKCMKLKKDGVLSEIINITFEFLILSELCLFIFRLSFKKTSSMNFISFSWAIMYIILSNNYYGVLLRVNNYLRRALFSHRFLLFFFCNSYLKITEMYSSPQNLHFSHSSLLTSTNIFNYFILLSHFNYFSIFWSNVWRGLLIV